MAETIKPGGSSSQITSNSMTVSQNCKFPKLAFKNSNLVISDEHAEEPASDRDVTLLIRDESAPSEVELSPP